MVICHVKEKLWKTESWVVLGVNEKCVWILMIQVASTSQRLDHAMCGEVLDRGINVL